MSKARLPKTPSAKGRSRKTSPSARPTFPEIYMKMAFLLARRSTCKRLQVGTVIASADYRRILAVGYNGNATGLPNRCDRDEEGNCGCLHSEENAVINCAEPRETRKIVLVTHLPCVMCAKRLINLGGVTRIYYAREYRNVESIEILERSGIEVVHFPESEA
jgi:dCMP deaminase